MESTTVYGREWNEARKAQGFTSQEHLDTFYAYLDHSKSCPNCQHFTGVPLDDGFQPAQVLCNEGERLYSIHARM